MLTQKNYANGQKTYEVVSNKLTYFFKNGKIRAEGIFEDEKMQGEWKFYRATGELWQIGNFEDNKKYGIWIRYNINGEIEYHETFINDKIVRNKK